MNQTLEETLKAICAEHDLTSFGLSYCGEMPTGRYFTATCHWNGFSRRNISCVSKHAADVKSAVSDCLAEMRKDRASDTGEVPDLPAFEVAA